MNRHDGFLHRFYIQLSMPEGSIGSFPRKKRPDIAVYDYSEGKKLLLDITITHPHSKNFILAASVNSGHAAGKKRNRKIENSCRKQQLRDIFSVQLLWRRSVNGKWRLERPFTKSLLAPGELDVASSQFRVHWKQKLSVCLQKKNFKIVANKINAIRESADRCLRSRGFIPV